jgi:L-ascorbate metabolism protein UlaG (beta-lactamase superfamily)
MAAATQVLRTKLAVPIHYGRAAPGYIEDPDVAHRFLAAASARGVSAKIVSPGEWIEP